MNVLVQLAAPFLDQLVGTKCSHSLTSTLLHFKRHVFFSSCFELFISKALGLAIVATGCVVKVPQILKIVNARSAQGISAAGIMLETFAAAMGSAYNFRNANPFSTYGESIFITVQNIIVLALMAKYARGGGSSSFASRVGQLAVVSLLGAYLLFVYPIPPPLLKLLQTATIPINLASKVPQIVSNARNKNTGQLSAIVVFSYFAGTMARVFTTLKEVDDVLILAGNGLASIFNGVLLAQVLMYWNAKPTAPKDKKKTQ
ncbi:hypothetical protein RI367_000839 [Sorochytrium milnesiophthora]